MSRKDEIERLITAYKRRLQKLKEYPGIDPKILLEIEDIEAEIQRRQTQLADENYKNKDEIKRIIMGHERRLQKLKELQAHTEQKSDDKEIRDTEAEIQRLQTELARMND